MKAYGQFYAPASLFSQETFVTIRYELPKSCLLIYFYFVFEFPCIVSLYYIKNQQDATLAVLCTNKCEQQS
jgi:hypothetical protein